MESLLRKQVESDKAIIDFIKSEPDLCLNEEVKAFVKKLSNKAKIETKEKEEFVFDFITTFCIRLCSEPWCFKPSEIAELTDYQIIKLYMIPSIKESIENEKIMNKMR